MTAAQIKAWACQAPSTRRLPASAPPRENAAERTFRDLARGRAPSEVESIERELALLSNRADGRRA